MAFDNIKAEINILLAEMEKGPKNAEELRLQIHQKLAELKAFGMPLPQDLVDLEKVLDDEIDKEVGPSSG